MNQTIQTLQENIPLIKNATSIEGLSKGFSPEQKYIVCIQDRKLLLRVSDSHMFNRKKREFQILKDLSEVGVRTPEPLEVGMIDSSEFCYTLYSFMDGMDGLEAIKRMTDKEQFDLGVEVGHELRKLHVYQAPESVGTWYDRAMAKHNRYIEAYKTCGIQIQHAEKIANFIENHKHLLKNRPNQFQHDDIHLGNIIVKDKQYEGLIDFGNFDWGDPFHDFVKVGLFQREISVPFSRGQVMGYFDGDVPSEFWSLYSVYVAMVLFSSIVWSLKSSPEQVEDMIRRVNMILVDHDYFNLVKPTWFEGSDCDE
ncbi:aminoglycoside phosphotransferase family protein [Bacillus carboniphilus]|uniref:Aminoglycoside phosphotransferase family protein n=1 Tax=Bacillus carboniphilus TaxID=86663 RepID=A0ABP3G6X9_9BACI